ncbi:helix-turn-helix domain-containing protein [Ancylobacter pratisalsi]|uniref:Helix-turn-helix transcriptional regulator n=1 Tax=Ancylobacter pratisalsi TaxID=1745854 RepID=A0A6P1YHM8_9HYPH|nr:helix-turn-helix transcriptional regulator [Ancylobacter pratisalsi]
MSPPEFREWRLRLGLTQAQAARALGLATTSDGTSSDAVRHYENGRRSVPQTVAILCQYIERYGPLA